MKKGLKNGLRSKEEEMKIRMGFVSNSSSASFVLTVNLSVDDFLKTFYEEYRKQYLDRRIVRKYLEKGIKDKGKYITEQRKEKQKGGIFKGLYSLWVSNANRQRHFLMRFLKDLNEMSDEQLSNLWLLNTRVFVYKSLKKVCKIQTWTLMMNSMEDFGEGIQLVIKMLKKRNIEYSEEVLSD